MNLSEVAVKRPIFITCVVLLMLVLGFSSIKKMSVDLFPDVTFPILFVQVIYPGASPLDMEKQVSKYVEDELSSLSGLKQISSVNAESVSYAILEFKLGTDLKEKEQEVLQRVNNIRSKLPEEIEQPVIRRFDPADQAIVRIAVTSPLNAAELYDVVDQKIKPQFDTIAGVGQVKIIGGQKREVKVDVGLDKLQDRQLSLLQISDKIKATSKDVPIGKIKEPKVETVLRASGEFSDLDDLKNVNINFVGSDRAVKLADVANVYEGLEEETARSTFMRKEDNFKPTSAIFLEIFKQSGSNTIEIARLVSEKLTKVNADLEATKVNAKLFPVRDSAWPIQANVKDVRESILIGIILCIVVVFFFLGSGRSTFITAMALPNSLLGGFIIMYLMGFSINIMTLLALSLAVGLLIDDAIVVRENIFRHLEMGKSPTKAALEGTKEVALAVLATTLVVIAVFGPIAFLDGIIGQFFKQFGLTVVFAMLISMFDAFTVAPMLSAQLATGKEHEKGGIFGPILRGFDRFQAWLEDHYERILKTTIRHPMVTLVIATVIFLGSLSLLAFLPKTFLPQGDNGEFVVAVELPVGSTLNATAELVHKVEDVLKKVQGIELMATNVGTGEGAQSEANKGSIYLKLVPRKQRPHSTTEMKDDVRTQLTPFMKDAVVTIGDIDIGGGSQKIFNLYITGQNLDEVSAYVEKLKKRMEKIPGLVDLDTNYRTGKPEFHVDFERNKSESLGVSTVTAGAELRARVEGAIAGTYRKDGLEYDIRVRLNEASRDLRQLFDKTLVPNTNFNMIPLKNVAEGKESTGYSQINRQNKARYIAITANLGPKGNLGDVTSEVERLVKVDPEFKLPQGLEYRFIGQAEDFKDLMANMLLAMGLGVLFIYFVLASLYESFITPFSILLALPLAMVGALVALFITGKSVDLFSLIGIVMLLGVVAKNSILLVDYTNHLMQEGMERTAALVKAGKTRLRPILMTSLALIAGTIPLAIGLNEASAQRTSMGIAIIGGVTSSTILTLIVVPSAFGYIDRFNKFVLRLFNRIRGRKQDGSLAS